MVMVNGKVAIGEKGKRWWWREKGCGRRGKRKEKAKGKKKVVVRRKGKVFWREK